MPAVIGVFDTREDAESARESLIRAGFEEDDVRVQSHRRAQVDDEGLMAKVGRFFSDVFGSSDGPAGHYTEHVRRGGSVVVVDAQDENRLDQARSALASAGAVDINQRTEAWCEKGDSSFDAGARPYGADDAQAGRSRADNGAIDLEESTEHPVASKTARTAERSDVSGKMASMSRDDEMAYRYGSTLRSDQRYAGRSSWDEVEADARANWSERNPNSNWEKAKAAMRKGWESITTRP